MNESKRPVIQPIYNRPGNLLRKMALMQRYIDDIKNTLDYYGWVFARDPWFQERLLEAEKQYAELEKAFQQETAGLIPE